MFIWKNKTHTTLSVVAAAEVFLFQQYFVSFPLCLGRTLVEILPFSDGVTLGVGEMERGGRCAAW